MASLRNDNFRYEDLKMNGRMLTGIVKVVIELNGSRTKSKSSFTVNCEDLKIIEPISIVDEMPT